MFHSPFVHALTDLSGCVVRFGVFFVWNSSFCSFCPSILYRIALVPASRGRPNHMLYSLVAMDVLWCLRLANIVVLLCSKQLHESATRPTWPSGFRRHSPQAEATLSSVTGHNHKSPTELQHYVIPQSRAVGNRGMSGPTIFFVCLLYSPLKKCPF